MGSDKIVFVRADANASIASGHIMRCLTIAHCLRLHHAKVTFIVADSVSRQALLKQNETSILCLDSVWDKMDSELDALVSLISTRHPDYFLLDSYSVTDSYMRTLQSLVKLVYLDDLQAFPYPANLIINYDFNVDTAFYGNTPALTGPAYTPLRPQFKDVSYVVSKKVSSILLTTGATDPFHICTHFLSALLENSCFTDTLSVVHILAGSLTPNTDFFDIHNAPFSVQIHKNVSEMAALMAECDLAFSAGGTTLFELCSVGVPSVSFSISNEQLPCVNAFDSMQVIPYIGDVRTDSDFYNVLLEKGAKIAEDFSYRKEISAHMRNYIDGKGAERITQSILAL